MHENQRILNNMAKTAKFTLSNINDRDFTRDEIWDFIRDIIEAGLAILSFLVVVIVLALKLVDVGEIIKGKIKENVEQEVEKVKYQVDTYKNELKEEVDKIKEDLQKKVDKIENDVKDVEDKIKSKLKAFKI